MKKQIFGLCALLFFSFAVMAQDGRMQRQTPEERTRATMEKLADLKLTDDAKVKVEGIFNDFYKAQQKSMEEMRASGSMDREAMKAKRQELANERDGKLKLVLTADQLKKWSDEIEPSLRPQRKGNN